MNREQIAEETVKLVAEMGYESKTVKRHRKSAMVH